MNLRSPLKKVKGLGSAHNGTHHWWVQRVSAVALVPLVIWFVVLVIRAASGAESLVSYLNNPFFAVTMILFIGVSLYHGYLGMQVVIEDYVHCNASKTILITLTNFVASISAVAAILAIIYAHVEMPAPQNQLEKSLAKYQEFQKQFQKKVKELNDN
jgi:succinate dehydrogenase / fumarate reductase membrane anchor subunit